MKRKRNCDKENLSKSKKIKLNYDKFIKNLLKLQDSIEDYQIKVEINNQITEKISEFFKILEYKNYKEFSWAQMDESIWSCFHFGSEIYYESNLNIKKILLNKVDLFKLFFKKLFYMNPFNSKETKIKIEECGMHIADYYYEYENFYFHDKIYYRIVFYEYPTTIGSNYNISIKVVDKVEDKKKSHNQSLFDIYGNDSLLTKF
jgi:MoaA/NifB/PqqE/SkfB family radical SAM enzyme